jgi:NAD(P)-dependent dehydrogenase (short-subunit alcohol dehydrogenase family)
MATNDTRLSGRFAIVTGGTYGVGRGIAHELAGSDASVFVTGRSVSAAQQTQGRITTLRCDHRHDDEVDAVFERIMAAAPTIDVLVNGVWGGYDGMVENGEFTWPAPFREQPLWRWDAMFAAGVRAHYRASQIAARAMVKQRRGLIVSLSHWAAQKRIGNVAYGVAKAATDKMTADMAEELRPHGVAAVSLYPGLVRTEKVMASAPWLDLANSESPEFTGRAVVALAADPDVLRHSGHVRVVADLAREYRFTDVDGSTPRALTLADA